MQRYIFDKIWFKEHQKGLLWFANSIFGKIVFRNGKMGLYKGNNALKKGVPFIKITPNSVAQYVWFQGRIQIRENFWIKNEYSRKLFYYFYPIWLLFHIWDTLIANNIRPAWNLGFDTLTVYPDTGTGSTTCDAYVWRSADETWATIKAGAGTNVATSSENMYCQSSTNGTTDHWSYLMRMMMTFNTSSLGSGATISATVLSLYGYYKLDENGWSASYNIYTATPSSNNNIQASDYGNVGGTAQSDTSITQDGWSTSGYNDFTFNSTGRGNVSKTGISGFSLRNSFDVSGTPTWANTKAFGIRARGAHYGSNKPKLVVTYTSITAPTVTTQSCDKIAKTSVQGNGNITATGGENCSRRGFCYKQGTSGDPTTADSVAYDDGSFGTGAYTKSITGLSSGTSYRVRAYAVNGAGTSYGSTVGFTTNYEYTKTITERIIPISTLLKSTSKTFTTRIVILSSKILSIGKTLLQNIIAIPAVVNVLTAYKTLTERITTGTVILFSGSKVILESIIVNPLKVTVFAGIKTLQEALEVASNFDAQQIFVEVYTEIVNVVSPAITKVLSAARIITETIKVASSILKTQIRTLIEEISAVDDFIFSLSKTLVERVIVISGAVVAQMITLTNRLVISSTRTVMRSKTLTQIIEFISSFARQLNSYKTFSEIVSVISSKPVSIGRTIKATLRVAPLLAKKAGKTFVEVVVGATSWLFEKTQFVELTEHLTASMSFVKTTSKTFVQTVRVLPLFTYALARVFLETVAVQVNFLIARAYEFTETVKIVLAFGSFAIGKLLKEIVPVHLIFNEGRNTIFSETIQVASNIVFRTTKIFTEVVNAIGAMAGNAMARVFSQRVIAGATTRFRKTQHTILADSLKVAGQAYKMAGKTFTEIVSAVSAMGNWAIGKLIVQRINVTPDYSKAWTLSRVLSEMLAVGGNVFNQAGKTFTEAITVASTFVLGTISKLLTETINIIEKVNKSLPARVFSEAVSVSANFVNQGIKIFVETIAVVSQFVLGTISKLLLETVNVISEYTKVWELSRTFTEFMIIVGRTTNQTGRIFTEVLNVVNPLIAKLTGRTFTEIVVGAWDKTKFVLNGIQVGLWKKVARVVSGSWKKISRNDN